MDPVMLTTVDNPYNPYTHWDEWFAYDTQAGHHTVALLARVVKSSDELSQADQDRLTEEGMDEIIDGGLTGIHRKIYPNDKVVPVDLSTL